MQCIIQGMHRSGTSSVTKLVNMMGASIGEPANLVAANAENPKGFFERYDVININNRILDAHDSHWFHMNDWAHNDATKTPDAADDICADIKKLISTMSTNNHWAIKDPRMCHTLPFWKPHLDRPFLVIVHRNPIEIATSLNKRNGFSMAHGIALWEYAAIGMLNAARTIPHHIISYANLMRDPITTTKALYDALSKITDDLTLPTDNDITRFLDPSLYRSKSNDADINKHLNAKQQALVALLETNRLPDAPLKPSDDAKRVMQEVASYVPALVERESVKETLGHTEATLQEQRVRIEELMKERDQAKDKLTHTQNDLAGVTKDNTAKQIYIEKMECKNHALGLDKIERDLIKQSRWWKLRSWLLREEGVTFKELISRPK